MNQQEFLSRFQLQLDARGRCQPPTASADSTHWLTSLEHWTVISISGPDTRKFLQGQLSCDVNAVSDSRGAYGALCTPKGRMISNFYLLQGDDSDTLLMLLPTDCAVKTRDTLAKYIVFSKADMDIADDYALLGLGGAEAIATHLAIAGTRLDAQPLHAATALLLSPARALLLVKRDKLAALWETLAAQSDVVGGHHWELAAITDGIGYVYGSTQEEFIPQMLNMQLTDGISFDKGCYTGQEIVARTQYRGKIKRHMRRFSGAAAPAPAPGAALHDSAGKTIATVVSAETSAGQLQILAVVTGGWEDAQIASEHGVALREQALPYTLPMDDEL